jgi:hypothetical protein
MPEYEVLAVTFAGDTYDSKGNKVGARSRSIEVVAAELTTALNQGGILRHVIDVRLPTDEVEKGGTTAYPGLLVVLEKADLPMATLPEPEMLLNPEASPEAEQPQII